MELTSSAFVTRGPIPIEYTGDGRDVSPPLAWSDVPQGTAEFALICDDPDAPSEEPWIHWLVYKIPGDWRALPEGIGAADEVHPAGLTQGHNSWHSGSSIGYRGPAPPRGHGVHHYHFRLFALDKSLKLPSKARKKELMNAMEGHILESAELVGCYHR